MYQKYTIQQLESLMKMWDERESQLKESLEKVYSQPKSYANQEKIHKLNGAIDNCRKQWLKCHAKTA